MRHRYRHRSPRQRLVGALYSCRVFGLGAAAHFRAFRRRGAEVRPVRCPQRAHRGGPKVGAGLACRGLGPAYGSHRMSTIRVRSPASYWLAVPAAAWMLGVVVVPIVLLVSVSFLGGRTF